MDALQQFLSQFRKEALLILHSTAGGSSAQGIANYFKSTEGGNSPVSSHYVIGQDGTIVQVIAEKDGSYANGVVNSPNWTGNPNKYIISIEHCKNDTTNQIPLAPAQKTASFALIKDICQRNGIGMHAANGITGIASHADIDPVNRARCPGTYPWSELWAYLKGNQPKPEEDIMIDLNNPTVASHFSADGAAWQCTNGFSIHGEILATYQKYGNSALCGLSFLGLPLSNEIPITGHPGVVFQRFERGVLCFDPLPHAIDTPPGLENARVYPLHIDSGVGQDPRVAPLQGENDALKALLTSSKLGQISTIAKRVQTDVQLIINATQVQ